MPSSQRVGIPTKLKEVGVTGWVYQGQERPPSHMLGGDKYGHGDYKL